MAKLGEIQNIQSNILGYESLADYGFCRSQEKIDNASGTVKLGSILFRVSTPLSGVTTWAEVNASDIAAIDAGVKGDFEFAIVIGSGSLGEAIDADIEVSATADVMLLVNGAAIVRKQYLSYLGTQSGANLDSLAAAIEYQSFGQIKVEDSFAPFDGSYGDEGSV